MGNWTGSFTPDDPSLASLTDVRITGLQASDILQWNGSFWVNVPEGSLAGYVPYVGATTDVDLGVHALSAQDITLAKNISSVVHRAVLQVAPTYTYSTFVEGISAIEVAPTFNLGAFSNVVYGAIFSGPSIDSGTTLKTAAALFQAVGGGLADYSFETVGTALFDVGPIITSFIGANRIVATDASTGRINPSNLTGDVTTSGSMATTIANGVVTAAKLAPDVNTVYVPYTGATADVDLGTHGITLNAVNITGPGGGPGGAFSSLNLDTAFDLTVGGIIDFQAVSFAPSFTFSSSPVTGEICSVAIAGVSFPGTVAQATTLRLDAPVGSANDRALNCVGASSFSVGPKIATLTNNALVGANSTQLQNVNLSGDVTTTNTFVTAIGTNKVTNTMLRQSGATSVIGRSANSTGNVADILSTVNQTVLRRDSSGVLGFGALTISDSNAVTGILGMPSGGLGNGFVPVTSNQLVYYAGGSVCDYIPGALAGKVLTSVTTGVSPGVPAWAQVDLASMVSGTLQAAQFPALTGNVTTSAGGLVTTIASNAVTYAKMQAVSATSKLLGSSSTTTVVQEITIGSGLSLSGTTLTSTGLGGTVTSFSAGTLSPLFTTSVATATTTPALTFALTNAAANTYFGNATGSSGAPSYTAAAALTRTNDTNVTVTLGGAPTTSLLVATSLTLGWTGQLGLSRGGSAADLSAATTNGVFYFTGTAFANSSAFTYNAGTSKLVAPNIGINATPVNRLDVGGGAVIGATYAGTNTAPTNGLLVQGQTIFGATSSFIGGSVEIQGSDRISFGMGGTKTATDGSTQACFYVGPTYAPTSNTGVVANFLMYPQFNPPTGVTITTAYGMFLQTGGQAGLGTVTTGYNLYVDNPGFGTNKTAIYCGGNLGFGGTSYGGGALVIFIANASTNPTTNPTGGGVNYANAGADTWRGSGGSVTAMAPA